MAGNNFECLFQIRGVEGSGLPSHGWSLKNYSPACFTDKWPMLRKLALCTLTPATAEVDTPEPQTITYWPSFSCSWTCLLLEMPFIKLCFRLHSAAYLAYAPSEHPVYKQKPLQVVAKVLCKLFSSAYVQPTTKLAFPHYTVRYSLQGVFRSDCEDGMKT